MKELTAKQISSNGGKLVYKKYGRKHFKEIQKKSVIARRKNKELNGKSKELSNL